VQLGHQPRVVASVASLHLNPITLRCVCVGREQDERERSDSSMAKRGLAEERNRIRDRLNALERQKVSTYPASQVQRIVATHCLFSGARGIPR
jgi:hypothetical protein